MCVLERDRVFLSIFFAFSEKHCFTQKHNSECNCHFPRGAGGTEITRGVDLEEKEGQGRLGRVEREEGTVWMYCMKEK